ncbi:polyprenyl synthetase family protein [Streptomyces kunmingensis]|uniref:Polyprenyl synthetase family protein n=1 Tax=Streptomyces kunmingensis TaxID=68225 RepID=A0ABU6C7J8_9ACTN|nr:polyprenyl synthetase family protein [Streptomyces kunmingensis]MEB3960689.1 polyprenyl synthetase family protein [Streptomyces kunmingensis]
MTSTRISHVQAVEEALRGFFDERRQEAAAIAPVCAEAVTDLESCVLRGGKRVRPVFAWLGWLGAGGEEHGADAGPLRRVGAALELFHASALIHDDVIDASATRRGAPAVQVLYAGRHRSRCWNGNAELFGTGAAILLGDLAQNWADDLLHSSGLSARALARVAPVWSAQRAEVLHGQLLDVTAEVRGAEDIDTPLRVNEYKTASYTVARPLHIGAAVADADPHLIAAYRAFGHDIGVAFQLRDDLLGVFGAPEETGKPSGDDLVQGKRTMLFALALKYADEQDPDAAKFLRTRIGTPVDDDELATVRTVMTDVGAVDHIERDITRRTERALTALRTSTATAYAKDELTRLAISATQRAS